MNKNEHWIKVSTSSASDCAKKIIKKKTIKVIIIPIIYITIITLMLYMYILYRKCILHLARARGLLL